MIGIGFTGHRKDKLDLYVCPDNKIKIVFQLFKTITEVINNNPMEKEFHFYSGGAIGFDQIAFDVVEMIKKKFTNTDIVIINEIDVPFKLQYIRWSLEEQQEYFEQIKIADKVVMVDCIEKYKIKGLAYETYHPAKMQKRNEYMVDNSDLLIALWNGDKKNSGTYNCIKYAKRRKQNIIYLNPKDFL